MLNDAVLVIVVWGLGCGGDEKISASSQPRAGYGGATNALGQPEAPGIFRNAYFARKYQFEIELGILESLTS